MQRSRFSALLTLAVLTLATSSGCTALDNQLIGTLGAHGSSYKRNGETLSVAFIAKGSLKSQLVAAGVADDEATSINANVFKGAEEQQAAIAPLLIALGADFLVGQIKTEIDREAARYEYQFTANGYVDDFWKSRQRQYDGFEVNRSVTTGGKSVAAFRLIVALFPIDQGRLIEFRPVFLKTDYSGAKVPFWGTGVSTDVVFTDSSMWVEADGTTKKQQVGSITYSFGVTPFGVARKFWTSTNDGVTMGVVGAPQRSTTAVPEDAPKDTPAVKNPDGGVVELAVQVTEKDPSNAKTDLEKISKIAQDHQADFSKYVAGRVGGTAAANQAGAAKQPAATQPAGQ